MAVKTNSEILPVATKHPEYSAMEPYWNYMDDVTTSEAHMHEQGETYIPKLTKMEEDEYAAYVKRGAFPLYTKHALVNFVGMALRKKPLTTGINDDFKNNVDGTGTTLEQYIKTLLQEFLKNTRAATLVEYDKDMKRSKLLFYPARSVINWDTRVINSKEQLSLVVLRESAKEKVNEFSYTQKYRYRVLSLDEGTNAYRQRLYDERGILIEEHSPEKAYKQLTSIPCIIHGGIEPQLPVLLPIAEQNVHYYKLDVDYKHGLHFVALPTPWVTGVDPEDKKRPRTLGPTNIWYLPDESEVGMLEFTGAGLGEFGGAKTECLENIITLSSQILAPPQNVNETATAAGIRNAGETASLAELVDTMSKEATLAITIAINWTVVTTEEISVVINNDFVPTILSGADVASYASARGKHEISRETLFEVLKKGEIQDGNRAYEEELKAIQQDIKDDLLTEVELASKLAEVEAKYAPAQDKSAEQKDSKEIKDGKKTPQSNSGQGFTEN